MTPREETTKKALDSVIDMIESVTGIDGTHDAYPMLVTACAYELGNLIYGVRRFLQDAKVSDADPKDT